MNLADQIARAIQAELSLAGATRRSVAALYAVAIGASGDRGPEFWMPVNKAIAARFGDKGLDGVKKAAWQIHEATAKHLASSVQ